MHGPADARGRFLACLAPFHPARWALAWFSVLNIFLFVFLPLFLASYYLTPWRWKSLHILVFSYGFMLGGGPIFWLCWWGDGGQLRRGAGHWRGSGQGGQAALADAGRGG